MIRRLRVAAVACAFAFLQSGCGGGGDDRSPVERDTTYGTVVGTDDSANTGTYSWKGLPYAQPPVGALRWKSPAEPTAWTAPRTAQAFGNACVQTQRLYGPGSNNRYDATVGSTLGQTVGSEDCLYLNVWRPATDTGTLPVIVFIHGGSNISGYTGDPMYDGANLAKTANAVVVSVNYRLGIFGFFDAPSLKDGTNAQDDSGNFAILDLIQALKFINKNIAAFGGNPANVTVMGHSAGAVNTYALLTSPLMVAATPQLMQRAVPLSGGIALQASLPAPNFGTLSPCTWCRNQANALLQQLVVADGLAADSTAAQAYIATQTNAQLASYLRGKSADTLLTTVLTKLAALGLTGSNPIPEGTVLPADPVAAIVAGRYVKVPILEGNAREEGKLFAAVLAASPALGGVSGRLLPDATVFTLAAGYNPNAAPTTALEQWIPAAYLPVTTPTTGFNARTNVITQNLFLNNSDGVLNVLKAQQATVWAYRYDWANEPTPFNDIFGAAHGFDMPFVFGNFGPSLYANISYSTANQPGRLALSDAMMRSIGAFAANGDPNNAALGVTWPAWPSRLVFNATNAAKAISVQ